MRLALDFRLGLRQSQRRWLSPLWRVHWVMGTAGPAQGTDRKGNQWKKLMTKSSLVLSFLWCGRWQQCWEAWGVEPGSSIIWLPCGGGQWYRRPAGLAGVLLSFPPPTHPVQLSFAHALPQEALPWAVALCATHVSTVVPFHS